jgi:hypothetical protein
LGRHKPASNISRALAVLQEHGLARVDSSSVDVDGNGRPREVWFAVGYDAKKANFAK